MAGRRMADLTVRKLRVGYKDQDGKGSALMWVSDFHNALMQVRSIAFDGRYWFVQGNRRDAPFTPVGESEIPDEVKTRFNKFINSGSPTK